MAPAIQLTADHGPVGTVVTIDGTGFTALTAISFTYGGAPITPTPDPTTSGAGGDFSCTVVIPASVQGANTIEADDGILAPADADFTVESQTVITESNAQVGDTINVIGTGYDTLSLMAFTLNSVTIVPEGGAVTTDATGGFTTTFVIPAIPAGVRTLNGTDAGTNSDSDTIIIDPLLVITESTCIVGDTINLTGSGYAASEDISLKFATAGISPVSPITSDVDGGFTGQIIVPAAVNGSNTVDATDESLNTDSDTITVNAKITILPTSARIGAQFTVTGTGFAPADAITFTFDSDPISADSGDTSDSTGGFTATLTVPTHVSGAVTIDATDEAMNTDDDTFTVLAPTLTLTESSGIVGSTVTLTGANYVPNSTVTVTNIDLTTSEFTASATGTIPANTTILIPEFVAGAATVNADDGTNDKDATFTVIPSIVIIPTVGEAGTDITIYGHGYTNTATMTVRLNNETQTTTPSSVTADSDGIFECTITVPNGTPINEIAIVKVTSDA